MEVKCDECDDIFRNKARLAKHKKRTLKSDFDDISKKIQKLEEQIKIKEAEEIVQLNIVNSIEINQEKLC